MLGVAEVVAAGEAQPALAADYPTQGEGSADERPEDRGVEECVLRLRPAPRASCRLPGVRGEAEVGNCLTRRFE